MCTCDVCVCLSVWIDIEQKFKKYDHHLFLLRNLEEYRENYNRALGNKQDAIISQIDGAAHDLELLLELISIASEGDLPLITISSVNLHRKLQMSRRSPDRILAVWIFTWKPHYSNWKLFSVSTQRRNPTTHAQWDSCQSRRGNQCNFCWNVHRRFVDYLMWAAPALFKGVFIFVFLVLWWIQKAVGCSDRLASGTGPSWCGRHSHGFVIRTRHLCKYFFLQLIAQWRRVEK